VEKMLVDLQVRLSGCGTEMQACTLNKLMCRRAKRYKVMVTDL